MLFAVLAALQAPGWTAAPAAPQVGDTVVIERLVAAGPRTTVRAQPLDGSEALEPLRPPQVVPRADGVLVRYTVALFRTGPVTVRLPALQLLHPETGADAVAADSIVVRVASVLPPGAPADSIAPRASAAPFARALTLPLRLLLPVGVAVALLAGWVGWRRRPRRRRPVPPAPEDPAPAPVARWLGAGEARVAAAWGIARLRQVGSAAVPDAHDALDLGAWRAVLGVHRPDWPYRKLDDVLERLERARFAPVGAADVEELLVEVEELAAEMVAGAGAGAGSGEPGAGGGA